MLGPCAREAVSLQFLGDGARRDIGARLYGVTPLMRLIHRIGGAPAISIPLVSGLESVFFSGTVGVATGRQEQNKTHR